jgi:beta-lactam-binding protein with PASTA domain
MREPQLNISFEKKVMPSVAENPPQVAIREGNYSGMSFNEAFKMARQNGLTKFNWNNKAFTTKL